MPIITPKTCLYFIRFYLKCFSILFSFVSFFTLISKAQSLSYSDLITIQKRNTEKSQELLLTKKGFKVADSSKNGGFYHDNYSRYHNEYFFTYDLRVNWEKKGPLTSESVYIIHKSGYQDFVTYCISFTDHPDSVSTIEQRIKNNFQFDSSRIYRDQNKGILIENGCASIFDYPDIQKRLSEICSVCRGRGFSSDTKIKGIYNICPKCNGTRRNEFITKNEEYKNKVEIMKIDVNESIKNGPYLEPIACSKKKNYIALINSKKKNLTFITVVVKTDENLSLYKINADGTKEHMTGILKNEPVTYSTDIGSLWMVAKGYKATCVALFYVKDRQAITAIIK